MGSRFLVSLLASLLVTLIVLAGAGFAVTQLTMRSPRTPFRAEAFEFDLAPEWSCERDHTEYICVPDNPKPPEAIAVIALKERNDKDNLAAYEAHLREPQPLHDTSGKPTGGFAEIRYVRRRQIGHAEWVEALHIGSEIPSYETYYLATQTSNLGILVTMSVHKDVADTYIGQLTDMMSTLNVYQR